MTSEELLLKINGDASGAQNSLKEVGGSFASLFATIAEGVAVGELLSEAIGKVVEIVKELPGELYALAEQGSKVADVETAFQGLAGGADAAREKLQALRDGTRGTVTDFDLMKVANKAMSDGLHLSSDDFKLVAEGARLLAKQTGGETKDAFETLNQAMETGRTRALNQIGVHVDLDVALARYATSIGKTSDELTDHEKIAATSSEVLRQLKGRVADAGDQQLSFAERTQAAKVALTNFEEDLGKAIAQSPILSAGLTQVGKEMDGAFGSRETLIRGIVKVIDTLALTTIDAAQAGVSGAKMVGDAAIEYERLYYTLVGEMLDRLIEFIVPARAAASVFSDIPGAAGTAFRVAGAGMDKLLEGISTLKTTSKGWAEDATEDAKAFDITMDGVHDALGRISSAMYIAAAAAKATGEASAGAGRQMGDAFDLPSKSAEKIADMWRKTHEEWTREANKFLLDSIKAAEAANQKEAEVHAKAQTEQIQMMTAFHQKVQDMNLHGVDLAIVQIERERDAQIDALKAKATLSGLSAEQGIADAETYARHQIDLALGTADTIEERMRKQGVVTRTELTTSADDARRDYEQMRDSGEYTAAELQAAFQKWRDADAKAGHQWVNAWVGDLAVIQEALAGLGGKFGAFGQSLASVIGMLEKADSSVSGMTRRSGVFAGAMDANSSATTRWASGTAAAISVAGEAKNAWDQISAAQTKATGAMAGMSEGAKIGTAILPGWGTAIGAAAGAVAGLVRSLSAGRRAVEDFAKSMGGFDKLHEQLDTALGGSMGEDLWVKMTQGVKKGDAKGAKAIVDTINLALQEAADYGGTFDGLHDKLTTELTDGMGEQLWQKLNASLKAADASGAAATMKQIQTALANSMPEIAAQAGFQTVASLQKTADAAVKLWEYMRDSGQYTADEVSQAWQKAQDALVASGDHGLDTLNKAKDAAQKILDDLDGQIKSLQQSVDAEAPEEVMGVIETQQRAQLEALKKQREDAQKNLTDINSQISDAVSAAVAGAQDAAQQAGKATVDAIQDALKNADFRVTVSASVRGDGSGSEPGRASTGALVTAHGLEPLRFAVGGLVPFLQSVGAWPDTIPAYLHPGEVTLSTAQTAGVSPILGGA